MDLIIRLLTRLGVVNGKSLDGAIKLLTKLDATLEAVHADELAKAAKAEADIAKAAGQKADAEVNAARAARIRDRAKEFIA